MCSRETNYCPGCKQLFECNPGNITQCPCYGIELTPEVKAFIEQRFGVCLCRDCLKSLKLALTLFKEKQFSE